MKKAILLISIITLFFVGCKKDDIAEASKVRIETETIEKGWDYIKINVEYDYPVALEAVSLYLSEKEDMSDANVYECNVEGKKYSVELDSLKAGVAYYYCYEYDNGYEKEKGGKKSMQTISKPVVVTKDVTSITTKTATLNGSLTNSDAANKITEKGFCWGKEKEPTIEGNHISKGSGTGTYSHSLTNLTNNTTYYVRAYAKTNFGIVYGEEKSFTTVEIVLPTVTTNTVTNITTNSATCGGNVTFDGNATVTARGVCWSTSQNPTINDNKTTEGSGIGSYSSNLSNLSDNTTYYIRAYATNEKGTAYGEEKSFATLKKVLPTVTTNAVTNIKATTATCGGNVTFDGNSAVTARGICWSTKPNPTISDSKTTDGSGTGSYTSNLSNLASQTTYYVRAYATNEKGTAYGEEKSFTTLELLLPTVMTENITNIKTNSARSGGNVSSDGNGTVTARGICWSTSPNPTIDDNKTTDGSGTGSYTSNISNLSENTTYYVRAYATNEKGTAYGEEKSFRTRALTGTENGYGWVDLGLSVKWATCNVGANAPEGYGAYFAWGETTTKSNYSSSNSPTYGLSYSELKSQGYIDGNGNLNPQYDAATANWGGAWRMPTKAELNELRNNCTCTWTTQNGVNGYNVEGPNGNSIFLPAAGYRNGSSLNYAGGSGYYRSSMPNEGGDYSAYIAYILRFGRAYHLMDSYYRSYGQSVRPVFGGNFDGPDEPEVVLPSVTTKEVTNITENSATCGGNVTFDGNSTVMERGICWSTFPNPTINDNKTTDGSGTGSFTSYMSNLTDGTTYYVRAYAINEKGTAYGELRNFTTLEKETISGTENGHNYVDLGLPSGLKWATCNVGANSATEYGDYFAWGETTTKSEYTEENSATYGLSKSQLQSQGYIDSKGNLNPQYDAATANWGGDWRMPTYAELNELRNNCTWTGTTQNGVKGYKVTSKTNGNSIFLPAAGFSGGVLAGSTGTYWSSTLYVSYSNYAYNLYFDSDNRKVDFAVRHGGRSVRPVFGGNFEGPDEPEVVLPSVTTKEVTSITSNSAICGGDVATDGNATVTARGICWSTSQNPTINDNKTTDGSGTGSYTSNLSNLTQNTTYYVRAYATNEKGTSYGEQKSFTTLQNIELPTVTTNNVTNITTNSATSGGNVTDDGNATVTARGVCWSTSQNPTINDNKTTDGSGTGSYTSNLSNLTQNTTYYVRAYATNEKGTSYGEQKSFTTLQNIELPTVTTNNVTNITTNSATSGGNVTDDGNATVTARGVCWSTSQNPTINDNKTTDGSGTGSYTSNISNLSENTTYYVRAYATNEKGTSYGEEKSFTTRVSTGTENGYGWVDLGLSVKWANCNIGANKPEEYGDYFAWGETTTKSDYTSSTYPTYSLSISQLQSQGYIDSEGNLNPQYDAATANWGGNWRMPTKAEQEELLNNCTWTWTTQNGVNGYNVEGPNGNSIFLPAAGYRYGSSLSGAGGDGNYWSSTPYENYAYFAYYLGFYSSDPGVGSNDRKAGRSVRPILE